MLRLAWILAMLVRPAVAADDAVREIHVGRSFASDSVPAFDKGHLIFINMSGGFTLYGRDGKLIYDVTVKTPKGAAVAAS